VPLAEHCKIPLAPLNNGPVSDGCDVNIGCWPEIKS
jgi:hypothetical protein